MKKILYDVKFFTVPLWIWILMWGGFLAIPIVLFWLFGGTEGLLGPYLLFGSGLALALTITVIYENKVLGLEWPFRL